MENKNSNITEIILDLIVGTLVGIYVTALLFFITL
jgi:hypothetical protein